MQAQIYWNQWIREELPIRHNHEEQIQLDRLQFLIEQGIEEELDITKLSEIENTLKEQWIREYPTLYRAGQSLIKELSIPQNN